MSNKITCFDNQNTTFLLKTAIEKMAGDLEEMGIKIAPAGGNYSDNEFTMRLKLTVMETASGEDPREVEFKRMAKWYGLTPEDYGKKFISEHREYTICGISPSAKKYPVLAKRDDGVEYKFATSYVKELLNSGT